MFKIIVNDGTTPPKDNIYYIIGRGGIYLHKKMDLIESCVQVKNISFLEPVKTYAKLDIPKISSNFVSQMYTFFLEVYDRFKSESIILIFYNKSTKEYLLKVPNQEVSAAHLKNSYDITIPGFLSIGTCHSHAGFGAFHSSTDLKDEKDFDGLHITFGNLDNENISISVEISSNGSRFKCSPEDYLEGITKVDKDYNIELVEFPEEWMSYVTKEVYELLDVTKPRLYGYSPSLFDDTIVPNKQDNIIYKNDNPCTHCSFNKYNSYTNIEPNGYNKVIERMRGWDDYSEELEFLTDEDIIKLMDVREDEILY